MTRAKNYAPASVKSRRKDLPDTRPWASATIDKAVQWALADLVEDHGEKEVAAWFDGLDDEPVAVSTISRYKSGQRRFPASFLATLAEKHDTIAGYLIQYIAARRAAPADVAKEMSPAAAEEMRRAYATRLMQPLFPDMVGKKAGSR